MSFITVGSFFWHATQASIPATRGLSHPQGLQAWERAPLPTDPVGTFTGTFDGIHAGTEIQVQLADGTEIAHVESCDADHALTWNRYASGSANNDVTIYLISTVYENINISYTTPVNDALIPVQQRLERFSSY